MVEPAYIVNVTIHLPSLVLLVFLAGMAVAVVIAGCRNGW